METSLHRQLKERYARGGGEVEKKVSSYRIDVARPNLLVEIQHASLGSIRRKIKDLLNKHRVKVVKPIIARKHLVRLDQDDGEVVSRRLSPKRGELINAFDDLVHFVTVFPHKKLTMEFVLVDVEEIRVPGRHKRRRRRRKDEFIVADQLLQDVNDKITIRTANDLAKLLPAPIPAEFNTQDLAEAFGVKRWIAQRIAYCLRHTGVAETTGRNKQGWQYKLAGRRPAA